MDQTIVLVDLFLVHFFNFSVSPMWWTKLVTSQLLLHVKIHSIISYRITLHLLIILAANDN